MKTYLDIVHVALLFTAITATYAVVAWCAHKTFIYVNLSIMHANVKKVQKQLNFVMVLQVSSASFLVIVALAIRNGVQRLHLTGILASLGCIRTLFLITKISMDSYFSCYKRLRNRDRGVFLFSLCCSTKATSADS